MNEIDFPYYLPAKLKENFIGRQKELAEIDRHLARDQSLAICSFGGTGKTALALEYAHALKNEKNVIPRWFNASLRDRLETEYREFADVLDVKTDAKSIKYIIQKVNFKLEKTRALILFVFDNLEDYECIEDLVNGLPHNVKVLMTSRNQYLNYFVKKIKLEPFDTYESKLYIESNLASKHLTEHQKDKLVSLAKSSSGQILPLKLKKLVNYFNEYSLVTFEKMVEDNSLAENLLGIELHFFDELISASPDAFLVLHFCSFLKPGFVSFKFLFNLFKWVCIFYIDIKTNRRNRYKNTHRIND